MSAPKSPWNESVTVWLALGLLAFGLVSLVAFLQLLIGGAP